MFEAEILDNLLDNNYQNKFTVHSASSLSILSILHR